jgi:uroporphyrinogen III methyltransferase / synthase
VRVVLTRAERQADELAARLESLGHDVALCPLIAIEPLGDGPVDVEGYDWVIVTSPNGAEQLLRRRCGNLQRVAAIGPGTAAALRAGGVEADLVPRVSTQEGLLRELPRPAGRVLFAAAEGARRLLVDELDAEFVALYRTVPLYPQQPPAGDVVVLASASAAQAFSALDWGMPAISIGPQTTRAARAAGVHVVAEARTHDLDGLIAAIAQVAR